ncbi:pepsin/retropepsin-like aspartic protease family protein [Phenylobacterium sp.]|jgi:predicted aspartyl protease|uniref:pepsin/retropepsin-like aspartic protease family protein n=1 Tax=Phenylobacterium sp. TaxID=1871053 RepID=UPI002F9592D5
MFLTRRQAGAGFMSLAGAGALPLKSAWAQEAPLAEDPTEVDTTKGRWEHMVAPVTINAQGPFNFLMDTGANVSCVSNDLASKLMLASGPAAPVHTVVGVRTRPSFIIDHLVVGSRKRREVRAPGLPISGVGVDGVLGVDWLKGQRLVLDFEKKKIEITQTRAEHSGQGRVVVPARKRLGQLTIVDADLNGRNISAMIDSGSQVTMCNTPLRQLIAEAERGKKQPVFEPRKVRLETVAGEKFTAEMLFLPFLRLGGLHLGNVSVFYADMHVFDIWGLKDKPAIVLGMDLLTEFKSVALDFGRSQVRFDFADV